MRTPFLTLSVLAALALAGCDSGGGTAVGGSMTARVEGSGGFDATVVTVSRSAGSLFITGTEAGTTSVRSIVISVPDAEGTYTQSSPDIALGLTYTEGSLTGSSATWIAGTEDAGGTATVRITSIDADAVEGTFAFEGRAESGASGTKSVTSGEFTAEFGGAGLR